MGGAAVGKLSEQMASKPVAGRQKPKLGLLAASDGPEPVLLGDVGAP